MNFVHLEQLTLGNLGILVVAIVLVWLLYKATKHLVMGLVCLSIAVTAVGYFTGVISPDKAAHAAESVGKSGLQAAETEAKALGQKAGEVVSEEARRAQKKVE
jgi:membrane protein required for beta-lactamase induction